MSDVSAERWLVLLPSEVIGRDLAEESEGVYFHMWRTRQEPWTALQDGDTVYLVDRDRRRIAWELRARHVRRTQYHSMDEAYTALRESFGMFPEDLSDYVLDRPSEGFLLGWAVEVVAQMDVTLTAAVNFAALGARHGYLRWSRLPEGVEEALQVPPPGRPAIAEPADWMVGDSLFGPPAQTPRRYIPAAVRRAVWARDEGRCKSCGDATLPLHFDHIWPVSKGGGNEFENIQLLCRGHNLEKAARIVTEARRPVGFDLVAALAREVDVVDARADLTGLVRAAEQAGRQEDVVEALLQELDVTTDLAALVAAIELIEPDVTGAALLRARFAELVATDAPATAERLATPLVDHSDPTVRGTAALALAESRLDLDLDTRKRFYLLATNAQDRWVVAFGHLYLFEVEEDPAVAREHLEQAAASPDPTPRSRAAYVLGQLASDDDEAYQWYRRALITQEPELFALCTAELMLLTVGTHSCAYAKRALLSEEQRIQDRAHLVLGLNRCDKDTRSHLEKAASSADEAIQREATAALDAM